MYKCKLGCGLVVWDRDAHSVEFHAVEFPEQLEWPGRVERPAGMLAPEWHRISEAQESEIADYWASNTEWDMRHDRSYDEIEITLSAGGSFY